MNGALNLLGQADAATPLVAPRLPGALGPRLDVAWGDFHQGVGSNVRALLARGGVRDFSSGGFFKDCWIESRWPRRAIVAALLWHVAFLAMPFPKGALGPKKVTGLENFQLTWSGPIQDLPLLEIPKARRRRGEGCARRSGADSRERMRFIRGREFLPIRCGRRI